MQILRYAGALAMGVLLAVALPACSKRNAESPANPPTGVQTKNTPDTGGTGTEQPSPPAAPATPAASTPPTGQQPGH